MYLYKNKKIHLLPKQEVSFSENRDMNPLQVKSFANIPVESGNVCFFCRPFFSICQLSYQTFMQTF